MRERERETETKTEWDTDKKRKKEERTKKFVDISNNFKDILYFLIWFINFLKLSQVISLSLLKILFIINN